MTVRICDVTFSDWVSLQFENRWTDTFIFRIDARACIPPFEYAPLLKRIVAHTIRKRWTASIWVQVNAPGEWYAVEVQRSLKGLNLPYAVTQGDPPGYKGFSWPPWLGHTKLPDPPVVEEKLPPVSPEELRCLQALGRMKKGNEDEIASLAGLSAEVSKTVLGCLKEKELVTYKTSPRIRRNKSRPSQMDLFPLWHTKPKGLAIALRSWGVPRGIEFTSRLEENLPQIGNSHRYIARVWSAWLKSAWPQAEIWAGWSEVRIPEISVIPDGLAWGRIDGFETLFWLEVGDNHKSEREIQTIVAKRLYQARKLADTRNMQLIFCLLAPAWVRAAARWSCKNLPLNIGVVMGDWKRYGELAAVQWGKISGL